MKMPTDDIVRDQETLYKLIIRFVLSAIKRFVFFVYAFYNTA